MSSRFSRNIGIVLAVYCNIIHRNSFRNEYLQVEIILRSVEMQKVFYYLLLSSTMCPARFWSHYERAKARWSICHLANINRHHNSDFVDRQICCVRSSPMKFLQRWYYLYTVPSNFSTHIFMRITYTFTHTHMMQRNKLNKFVEKKNIISSRYAQE